jgi:glycosyltransferase involved in cell wall biosynthesis
MESKKQSPRLEKPMRITEQVWPEGTVPVVSIWCITYNHANFIRDAIEGFLMQETTFPVEIFVHDDASTDGTAEIVKEYAEKYPQLFWMVLQKENQWSKGNRGILFDYLANQRGELIAFCEGDDCWTSRQKLQKQVEMLLRDHQAVLTFHRVKEVSEAGGTTGEFGPRVWGSHVKAVEELIEWNFVPTCSVLAKAEGIRTLSVPNTRMGDWPMWLQLATRGNFAFLDEVCASYRRHSGGVWSALSPADNERFIGEFYQWAAKFLRKTSSASNIALSRRCADKWCARDISCALHLIASGRKWTAVQNLFGAACAQCFFSRANAAKLLKLCLRLTLGIPSKQTRERLRDLSPCASGPLPTVAEL